MVNVKAPSPMVAGMSRLGIPALTEHFGCERIDRKNNHEQGNASICQQRANKHDGEHGARAPAGR